MRYSTDSRPTGSAPGSAAVRVTGVRDVTKSSAPAYPGGPKSIDVTGGVSSTRNIAEFVVSTFPAKSSLNHSRMGSPSPASVNGAPAVRSIQGPPSTRYIVLRMPVPLRSETENRRGVADVTYVAAAVTFGWPTRRTVMGPRTTATVHVYRLFVSSHSTRSSAYSTSATMRYVPG